MSFFYCGDIVEFKDDSDITGVIDATWSDVEGGPTHIDEHIYVQRCMPTKVSNEWRKEQRLLPGYVIVDFMLTQNGFCLIAENSLRLRDRPLFLGDIVKRKASDQQSGRVMSTSAECTLEPACSLEEYANTRPFIAQDQLPHHGAYPPPPGLTKPASHGLHNHGQPKAPPSGEDSKLTVPAAELRYFQDFELEDFIMYQDWIGRVASVEDEVTLRLTNGSVVVVETPENLEVPIVPGTSSHKLIERLNGAGYYHFCDRCQEPRLLNKPRAEHAEYFYPGQQVQTKKGNLRRGRWLYGAYDANVEPQGIIVHVRTIEVGVDWLCLNPLNRDQLLGSTPPNVLNIDVLESGQIKILDKGRLPQWPLATFLDNAAPEVGTEYGSLVRFKDPADAAVKHAPKFKRIARIDTQGFEMNVLQVTSTQTKVLVQWQDGSMSKENAVSLSPSLALDENDVWPGDRVSLKADETIIGMTLPGATSKINARTIGVVQTVNAVERLAKVRWFQGTSFKIELAEDFEKLGALPSSTYGTMTDIISEVSLYDIATYNALDPKLGDIAIACPATAVSQPQLVDYSGEVVKLCLDGGVIIRCYAASEPRDIKAATSELTIVDTGDREEYEDESDEPFDENQEDDEWSDEMSSTDEEMDDRSSEASLELIGAQIACQGSQNADTDGDDDDAWSTDNEVLISSIATTAPPGSNDDVIDPVLRGTENKTSDAEDTLADRQKTGGEPLGSPLTRLLAPLPFSVLEQDPPPDHHYSKEDHAGATKLAKRAAKEHKIMQSSLPYGVFVRTWENRLDLLRVLIVGPVGTPYEHAPFLFDLFLPTSFPDEPPKVFFHSWTNNLGRINPNLYEDGKVCLSLLGTWPADERNEGWSKRSTILQVLVSILGLILVKEPYYSKCDTFAYTSCFS